MNIKDIIINDGFWSDYKKLAENVVLPYQWNALNDKIEGADPSRAVRNMKIAAGLEEGEFYGFMFQDSDLMKWIEAAAYSLNNTPDEQLEKNIDELVSYMKMAQQPDGYLNSYYILKGIDKKLTNLRDCHELYCLGHMIEGAVAYFEATGKREFLDITCKFVDLIYDMFGDGEGKALGYPGHQEIELALVKLYDVTKDERHLKLAEFFINQRGTEPHFFREEWEKRGRMGFWSPVPSNSHGDMTYFQAHLPVREQKEAVGHAVRAVYMYTGMAAVAEKTGDETLVKACKTLWDNVVQKQMYVTGGIGQSHHGEAFTFDYDLPNDTIYAETCASIGLVFFAYEMIKLTESSEYADVMEKALYNAIIGGMAKDGKHFFYVNPLEVYPKASEKNPDRRHVKPQRQAWFGCSCCPPNVARLLTGLGKYIYTLSNEKIFVNLYIGSAINLDGVTITQESGFPWNGNVKFTISCEAELNKTIALRIPVWCKNPTVYVNGQPIQISADNVKNGYLMIDRVWQNNDSIVCEYPMKTHFVRANKNVRSNAGKAAVVRGPLVFCAEEADNCAVIPSLSFDMEQPLEESFNKDLLGGTIVIKAKGTFDNSENDSLYFPVSKETNQMDCVDYDITLIPYYLWGNRGVGEMSVWLNRK